MSTTQYILIVTFIIMAIWGFFSKEKTLSRYFIIIFGIFLAVVIAYRPREMADYENYEFVFNYGSIRAEPVFQFLYNTFYKYKLSTVASFFVIAFISVFLKLTAINKLTSLPVLAIIVWIGDNFIIQEMITIRAGLATGILLWIIYFKKEGKALLMWFSIGLAICCHYSAAVFLVIPFLSLKYTFKYFYVTLLLGSMIFAFFEYSLTDYLDFTGIEIYDDKLKQYLNITAANRFNLLVLGRTAVCLALWMMISKLKTIDAYLPLALKIYSIGCILYYMTWKLSSIAFRFGELLWVTDIILFPYLIYLIPSRETHYRKLIPIIVSAIAFTYTITYPLYWNN